MVAARARQSRRYDPAKVRAALVAQTEVLRAAVRGVCAAPDAEARLGWPTRLGEWTVRDLVAHFAIVFDWLPRHFDDPVPPGRAPLSPLEWVAGTRTVAQTVDSSVREKAAAAFAGAPAEVAEEFDLAADRLLGVLAKRPDPMRPFVIRFGVMTVADFLVTRLVETVVHGDDLADALGIEDFPHDRQALAAVTRLLADAFAEQVPGGSVELRVPPYAVVQAVPGPKHTRGTPPNVVETDPLTWLRLATGRTDWASALDRAAVSASGERSDLSGHLPVMG